MIDFRKKMSEIWNGKLAIWVIACLFLSCIVSYLAYKYFDITKYESVFIFYEVFILGIFAIVIKKSQNRIYTILKYVCIAAIGVLTYSILTFGQAFIHSDIATSNALIMTQVESRSFFPDNWTYGNGAIWIISPQLFCYPFVLLMQNQTLAREMGALACFFWTCIVIYWFTKKVLKVECWYLLIPFLYLYMWEKGTADVSLYQNAYNLNIAINLLLLGCFYKASCEGKRRAYGIYCILMIICGLGSTRFYAEEILPLVLTILLYIFFVDEKELNYMILTKRLVSAILPMMLGTCVRIISFHNISMVSGEQSLNFAESIHEVFANTIIAVENCFHNFGFPAGVSVVSYEGILGLCTTVVCLFLVFIFPIALILKFKEESLQVKLMVLFTLAHNITMVSVVALCGKTSERYMLTSEYFSLILAAIYVERYVLGNKRIKMAASCVLVAVSILMSSKWIVNSKNWDETLYRKKMTAQTLVDAGLSNYKGYATYWTSNALEVYSNMRLKIGNIIMNDNSYQAIQPYYWLDDNLQLQASEEQGSYVVLTESEDEKYGARLYELYGETQQEILVPKYHVYVWNYDIALNNFVGVRFRDADVLRYMLVTGKETDEAENTEQIELNIGEETYGPYIQLPKGEYEIEINIEGGTGELCRGTSDCGEKEIFSAKLNEGTNLISFPVKSDIKEFEIKCICSNANYRINSIVIRSTGE